jgi:hypothetical protein
MARRELAPHEIDEHRAGELIKCYDSHTYFIDKYCRIYDSVDADWVRFKLWPEQKRVLEEIHANQLTVILKARQLGISWLSLGYALWQVMFRPIAAVSVFSRRETEAMYLLGQDRLRGMFNQLPAWMKTGYEVNVSSGHEWILKSGSAVRAFPTSAGDGYVSTLAIVDEADLSPDLNKLLRAVKPTIDNGGKLILLSRANKTEPESEFKNIYRGAREGENGWNHIFLPWSAHPGRDADWYLRQQRDIQSRTGSLDDLYEQYPATDDQALSARTLDKRIPYQWLEAVFEERTPKTLRDAPGLPGLLIYHAPMARQRYVIGADPAEGNPNSDDSSLTVIDLESGQESAILAGKFEPAVFASYIADVSEYYDNAPVMVERNNHGHSVIQWLEEHARHTKLLLGHDAESHKSDRKTRGRRKRMKPGWLSSPKGKTILYTACAEHIKHMSRVDNDSLDGVKIVHNRTTFTQLASIEAATLRAPQGQNDDRADSFALAQAGRSQLKNLSHSAVLVMGTAKGWGL